MAGSNQLRGFWISHDVLGRAGRAGQRLPIVVSNNATSSPPGREVA
jgi:hypothetical protein